MSDNDPPRVSRRKLFDLVWTKPMTSVAADLGTNDYHVRALCKRLLLPVPVGGHWMKAEVGKAPATPLYPADARLDQGDHALSRPLTRTPWPLDDTSPQLTAVPNPADLAAEPDGAATELSPCNENAPAAPHKLLRVTRAALVKSSSSTRVAVGGAGKFRLYVTKCSGERACALLDRLVLAVEAEGWSVRDSEQGYQLVPDDEPIGFAIEEKLDAHPHVRTPKEDREFADYERKCALADRGVGYRPWPPTIPTHDYEPNGLLTLKLDEGLRVEGLRRTFSDGKRQRLEDLIPALLTSLRLWAAGRKSRRAEQEAWQRSWQEQEARRRAAETRRKMDGHRMTFVRRLTERLEEMKMLRIMIERWEPTSEEHPEVQKLVSWARAQYQVHETLFLPSAIEARLKRLRLMDEDAYIYEGHLLE